jgi:hypothetical protein
MHLTIHIYLLLENKETPFFPFGFGLAKGVGAAAGGVARPHIFDMSISGVGGFGAEYKYT